MSEHAAGTMILKVGFIEKSLEEPREVAITALHTVAIMFGQVEERIRAFQTESGETTACIVEE